MKCHYDVLEVDREADQAEIKSAYRKLALRWHPDKNLSSPEEAKQQFQLVQQAYEILSDPQERAWYDKHREQFLRGSNSEFEDNSLDLFQYFTTTCFKGHGDDKGGFYAVYRAVFDALIKEELEFIENKEEFCDIPTFGDSQSDYDEVVGPFYAFWTSFSTRKSYVWLDPYDIKEMRDRRSVKAIEKENKKIRAKAKKERNDEVRTLVAFVRKRDKRVQAHTKLVEAKNLENRLKQEELSKQKRLERKKELMETGVQAEWAKFDNVKSGLKEIEKHLADQFGEEFSNSEDEDDYYDDNLYCVACNKVCKTPQAFANHESSRKHKENVSKLKETMLEEEEEVSDEDEELGEEVVEDIDSNEEDQVENNETEEEKLGEDSDVQSDDSTDKKKQKNKKKKKVLSHVELEHSSDLKATDSDDDFDFKSSKTQKRTNKTKTSNVSKAAPSNGVVENSGEATSSEIKKELTNAKKKKQKKKESNGSVNITEAELDTDHICVTCKSNFPSKNKLFDHLKKTGHGVYLGNKKSKRPKEK